MTTKQEVLTYLCILLIGYVFTWVIALIIFVVFFLLHLDTNKEPTL